VTIVRAAAAGLLSVPMLWGAASPAAAETPPSAPVGQSAATGCNCPADPGFGEVTPTPAPGADPIVLLNPSPTPVVIVPAPTTNPSDPAPMTPPPSETPDSPSMDDPETPFTAAPDPVDGAEPGPAPLDPAP
jgi:hypothetical protein